MQRGDVDTRADANYHALRDTFDSVFPIVELGTLTLAEPDYGLSARAVARTSEAEPRYIRITDFGDDGIEPGHEFVTAEGIGDGNGLHPDDILFARSGSVGRTYIHEDTSQAAVFAGYCIRFRFDQSRVSPRFVYWWTKTDAYLRWVAAIQRTAAQPNINKEEYKGCLMPLPPLETQDALVAAMDAARAERRAKLAEAEALLAGIDDFLLEALGIAPPVEDGRRVFAVRGQAAIDRFDPHFHSPDFARIETMLSQTSCEPLGNIATLSGETWKPQDYEAPTFRYIEISTVSPQTGEAYWNDVPTAEAPSRARMQIRADDIIVSLTRPHHGSIAHLGPEFDGCIASTGFAVIRNVAEHVDREYLWCVLRAKFSLQQMRQRASGGNYPAITESELGKILLPVPAAAMQASIVDEIRARREQARRLRGEAEAGWAAAKGWFEVELLERPAG